jgi:TetR/AcrR family transcriptional regulator, regulator of cefoperazone and chloramphenicol sensitivity
MTSNNKKISSTHESLLKAACEVFAQKGYRDATVADICEQAGANIAAVNYHFGNKETLYVEAWRMSFQESMDKYPPDGGIDQAASLEERLDGHVRAMLRRCVDPNSFEFEIMLKEFANPTGLLFDVVHKSLEPLRQMFLAIVRGLLGPQASQQQVELCMMSIRSQCFDVRHHVRHQRIAGKSDYTPPSLLDSANLDEIADHIVRFSLAGIREIRQRIQK